MATLPPNVQTVIRETAVQSVQKEMWDANITEQQTAWDALASRIKANATPDIDSFRAKMGPVLTNFVTKTGPKGKALTTTKMGEAVLKAL